MQPGQPANQTHPWTDLPRFPQLPDDSNAPSVMSRPSSVLHLKVMPSYRAAKRAVPIWTSEGHIEPQRPQENGKDRHRALHFGNPVSAEGGAMKGYFQQVRTTGRRVCKLVCGFLDVLVFPRFLWISTQVAKKPKGVCSKGLGCAVLFLVFLILGSPEVFVDFGPSCQTPQRSRPKGVRVCNSVVWFSCLVASL